MRVKQSIKNATVSIGFNIVTLFLNFLSRSVFIYYLGGSILGLNTVLLSIIGMLNLAEIGIGTAVDYELYKPIEQKDYKKISEIMVIFRKMYACVGSIIFVIGLCIVPFLGHFTKNTFPYWQTVLYFMVILVSTAGTYFLSYKQALIYADQKGYIVTKILGYSNIIKILFQIVLTMIFKSYLIWIILNLAFNFGYLIFTNRKLDKIYPKEIIFKTNEKFSDISKRNKGLIKNIKNIFYHKFAEIVFNQTDPLVIAAFSTLKETGIYSNYVMITSGVYTLASSLFQAMTASIGNLIASESEEKTYSIFRELAFGTYALSIIICFPLYMVMNKFIIFWLGPDYLFKNWIVIILLINFYIALNRTIVGNFKNCYGIYWDVWAPVTETIINLVFSIILSYKFGIVGVFIGTLISNICIILIWQPYTIFRYGFKRKAIEYYIWYIKFSVLSGIMSIIGYYVTTALVNLMNIKIMIINVLVTGVISVILITLLLVLFNIKNENMYKLINRVKAFKK